MNFIWFCTRAVRKFVRTTRAVKGEKRNNLNLAIAIPLEQRSVCVADIKVNGAYQFVVDLSSTTLRHAAISESLFFVRFTDILLFKS